MAHGGSLTQAAFHDNQSRRSRSWPERKVARLTAMRHLEQRLAHLYELLEVQTQKTLDAEAKVSHLTQPFAASSLAAVWVPVTIHQLP